MKLPKKANSAKVDKTQPQHYSLLYVLAARPGQAFTRREIAALVNMPHDENWDKRCHRNFKRVNRAGDFIERDESGELITYKLHQRLKGMSRDEVMRLYLRSRKRLGLK